MIDVKKLWNSPTVTAWAYQAGMGLQLVLTAPLILSRFDTVCVAAWYLFVSLNFFGALLIVRVSLTFSRIVSMRLGMDLKEEGKEGFSISSQRVWDILRPVIGTMGVFQLTLVGINFLAAWLLAKFSLDPVIANYSDKATIWNAFMIYQIGSGVNFYLSRYHSLLLGFDKVAVSNRIHFVSLTAGQLAVAGAIHAGAGLVLAITINQLINLVGGFWAKWSLVNEANGANTHIDCLRFSRDVAGQAIRPITQSLIAQIAGMGLLPMICLLVARSGDAVATASFVFYTRILTAAEQAGTAPFNSVQPKVSRLMAAKQFLQTHHLLKARMRASLIFYSLFGVIGCSFVPLLLRFVDSAIMPIPSAVWLPLLFGLIYLRFNSMLLAPYYALNEIALWGNAVAASFLALLLISRLVPAFGLEITGWGILGAILFAYRTRPMFLYSSKIGVAWRDFYAEVIFIPLTVFAFLVLIVTLFESSL